MAAKGIPALERVSFTGAQPGQYSLENTIIFFIFYSPLYLSIISISHIEIYYHRTYKEDTKIYKKDANTDAARTVKSPDTAIERLLIAPSTSPISNAFDVPMACAAVPKESPTAIGS